MSVTPWSTCDGNVASSAAPWGSPRRSRAGTTPATAGTVGGTLPAGPPGTPSPFATIDAEDFFDFTVVRPRGATQYDGHQQGHYVAGHRAVLQPRCQTPMSMSSSCSGVEPQAALAHLLIQGMSVAHDYEAFLVVSIGQHSPAEVPQHSRPVTGHPEFRASDPPACIHEPRPHRVVLRGPRRHGRGAAQRLRQRHLRAASLWAEVPTYVPAAQSPKATLALVGAAPPNCCTSR